MADDDAAAAAAATATVVVVDDHIDDDDDDNDDDDNDHDDDDHDDDDDDDDDEGAPEEDEGGDDNDEATKLKGKDKSKALLSSSTAAAFGGKRGKGKGKRKGEGEGKEKGKGQRKAGAAASATKAKVPSTQPAKRQKSAASLISDKEAPAFLIKYLREMNRPYSAIQIFENCQKRIKRPIIEKLLDHAAGTGGKDTDEHDDSHDIFVKAFGKTTLYWFNQNRIGNVSADDITELNEQLKQANEHRDAVKGKIKNVTTEIQQLQSAPSTEMLGEQCKAVAAAVEEKKKKLAQFQRTLKPVTLEQMKGHHDTLLAAQEAVNKRKSWCKKIIEKMNDYMGENPNTTQTLIADGTIQGDEDSDFPPSNQTTHNHQCSYIKKHAHQA